MAEYPNNSHSARERTDSTAPGKAEKKLEKVVTGAAKTRKKSEARKFVNIFVRTAWIRCRTSLLGISTFLIRQKNRLIIRDVWL